MLISPGLCCSCCRRVQIKTNYVFNPLDTCVCVFSPPIRRAPCSGPTVRGSGGGQMEQDGLKMSAILFLSPCWGLKLTATSHVFHFASDNAALCCVWGHFLVSQLSVKVSMVQFRQAFPPRASGSLIPYSCFEGFKACLTIKYCTVMISGASTIIF